MAKETFENWWKQEIRDRFFVVELKIGKKFFEDWYLPLLVQKFGAKRMIMVESEEDWQEKSVVVREPSLFSETILVLLWEIPDKTAQEIKEKFSVAPFFFLFLPSKIEERNWRDVPWIVVETDEKRLRDFWHARARDFGVSLSKTAEKKLFQFLRTYDLGERDIIHFLSFFAGRKELRGEDVECFFEREEKPLLFRFLDALGEKDEGKAIYYLNLLWRIGFLPARLMAQIARRFRILLQYYEGRETTQDLWQGKALHPFEAEKIKAMQQKYSLPEVYRAFALLRTADRLIKTKGADPKIVLTQTVGAIMSSTTPDSVVEQDVT